ncbi:MAG: D-aminoacyl-tRNA deacylase [candidate division WOR-3 bacterium]|nr:D-aminoacyl-tRNA deacylase [candidate division WOR-3 bacterium]MDH5683477.1 D-aminoacyl-tRNA deacylase [candidate division WOR-3 bacterium]
MKAVIQRVNSASVEVNNPPRIIATIGKGLLILLGIGKNDTVDTIQKLTNRIPRLRIFEDGQGKMNRSLIDIGGEILVVSQFTLYADTEQGLRPSFTSAGEPKLANELYERFVSELRYSGIKTSTGIFGARMNIKLENNGPVTFILEA